MPAPPRHAALCLLVALAALAPGVADAQSRRRRRRAARVRARIISVRGDRVYLERKKVRKLEEALLRTGTVRIKVGRGKPFKVRLIAVSSKYLVLEKTGDLVDAKTDDPVLIGGWLGRKPRRSFAKSEKPTPSKTAPIQIGRPQPTRSEYLRQPAPKRELVPFRGLAPEGDSRDVRQKGKGKGEGGEPGEWTLRDENGNALTPSGRIANQVKGEAVVGVEGVYDTEAQIANKGISRTTPYARLRLEVRQLGGSDRASFSFYGSVRQPINERADDWTGHGRERLDARVSQLVFELEAEQPEQIQSFTDRIELAVGRSMIPGVVQAGLVDGVRLGFRVGPLTPFGFIGAATSLNPRRADYDSVIYGGGARFETAVGHNGALRLSFAGAQEKFRGKGERDFFELNSSFRLGAFGMTGSLVTDLFDTVKDKQDLQLTTGYLSIYGQLSRAVRFELGYRERRPHYQRELLVLDLDPLALVDLNRRTARRNLWATLTFRLPDDWTLWLRAEHYQGRRDRDATGATLGVGWRLNSRHRVSLEMAIRRRFRSDYAPETTTDPFVLFTYTFTGDSLTAAFSIAYRDSLPKIELDDRRVAFRLFADYDIGKGFGIRGHAEFDFRRDRVSDGVASYLGLAARYQF